MVKSCIIVMQVSCSQICIKMLLLRKLFYLCLYICLSVFSYKCSRTIPSRGACLIQFIKNSNILHVPCHVLMDSLRVIWFPPRVVKHATQVNWRLPTAHKALNAFRSIDWDLSRVCLYFLLHAWWNSLQSLHVPEKKQGDTIDRWICGRVSSFASVFIFVWRTQLKPRRHQIPKVRCLKMWV